MRKGKDLRRSACLKNSLAVLIACSGLGSGLAMANQSSIPASANYHIYGGAYYVIPDEDRTEENENFGWQVALGKRLAERVWLEGQVFGNLFEQGSGAGTDFYQYGLGLDLQYAFGNRDDFTPYVLAGIGGAYNDVTPNSDDETTPFANVGIGFTKRITSFDRIRLRGEARAIYDDFLTGMLDYRIGLGVEMALGKTRYQPPEQPAVVIKEVPVVVERVVEAKPQPYVDPDLDKDGVVNEKDACPNTLAGLKVDGRGCVVEQKLTMRDVTFEFNSSKLTLNAERILDEVVKFLDAEPSVKMTVSGHTDSKGSDAYNLKLSRERAASVRQYLVSKGISSPRLFSEGYGESRPVETNDTERGREANRRVEFDIRTSGQ